MSLIAQYFSYIRYQDTTMKSTGPWHKIRNTSPEFITTECQITYRSVELNYIVFSNERFGTQECETCMEIVDTLGTY